MTLPLDDDILDDLFHGCALQAYPKCYLNRVRTANDRVTDGQRSCSASAPIVMCPFVGITVCCGNWAACYEDWGGWKTGCGIGAAPTWRRTIVTCWHRALSDSRAALERVHGKTNEITVVQGLGIHAAAGDLSIHCGTLDPLLESEVTLWTATSARRWLNSGRHNGSIPAHHRHALSYFGFQVNSIFH